MISFQLGRNYLSAYHGENFKAAGRLEFEINNGLVFVHYEVFEQFRRSGIASQMLDVVPFEVNFVDDPRYTSNGNMTPAGQAFADAYRTRHDIPLPPLMWVDMDHPSPGIPSWGNRKLVER